MIRPGTFAAFLAGLSQLDAHCHWGPQFQAEPQRDTWHELRGRDVRLGWGTHETPSEIGIRFTLPPDEDPCEAFAELGVPVPDHEPLFVVFVPGTERIIACWVPGPAPLLSLRYDRDGKGLAVAFRLGTPDERAAALAENRNDGRTRLFKSEADFDALEHAWTLWPGAIDLARLFDPEQYAGLEDGP